MDLDGLKSFYKLLRFLAEGVKNKKNEEAATHIGKWINKHSSVLLCEAIHIDAGADTCIGCPFLSDDCDFPLYESSGNNDITGAEVYRRLIESMEILKARIKEICKNGP